MDHPQLTILLASPRGFCAGVVRAIDVLDRVLDAEEPPIYAFHEIVHNRYVVDGFRERGAVFVDSLAAVPPGARVAFSGHGVAATGDAAAGPADALRRLQDRTPPATATLAAGPEGGWSPDEVAAATAAGFMPVTLGRRTLRADAVVVCAVSVLQYVWGDL